MKPQAAITVAITILSLSFAAGCMTTQTAKAPASSPPTEARAIVETSPSPPPADDAFPAIPPPPSFDGTPAEPASDGVTAYLRWLNEIELRRHLAVGQIVGAMQESGFAVNPTDACQGRFPDRPAPTAEEKEKLELLKERTATAKRNLARLAEEAKSQTPPADLQKFQRPYGEFVQWNGEVLGAMAEMQMQVLTALERNDADALCKVIVRYVAATQEISQQDARLKRLLSDLNAELDAARAKRPDLPDPLRSLRIEMP